MPDVCVGERAPLDSCPLYFRYKGKGTLDILSITLA